MTKPNMLGALTKVAEDEKAPIGLRVRALESIDRPPAAVLLRIMRHPQTPAKLRALASLAYAAELKRRAKQKDTNMHNKSALLLGLKV